LFLLYTDYLVEKEFDSDFLKLFGFNERGMNSISNHLAAIIQPKCLLNELEHLKQDITVFRKEQFKIPGTSPRTVISQSNFISSWTNEHR